ncbi:uncharacterized protein LOC135844396 isoform X8 [Planococcus citri]|uniref:uncharacterized protein LOC135844396 isoform X8 n=1 Tax=Planococcus citri TaxID=170843 RepID=UPI0031F784B8
MNRRMLNPGSFEHAERKPIIAPKLEKIASVRVAIALWNRATVAIPGIIENHYEWRTSVKDKIPHWIDALPLPKSFSSPIQHHFNFVSSDVDRWTFYISSEFFFPRPTGYGLDERPDPNRIDPYELIDYIIWHPNGAINSAETARNLLTCDRLKITKKFRFACTYCLPEEIEKMWPKLPDKSAHVNDYYFSQNPMECYWRCVRANELGQIYALRNQPIDELMIRHPYVNNWPAIEYFFDRLDAEQQVIQTIRLIDKYGLCFQKLLLLKLNESQRERVILQKIVQIMDNYTSDCSFDDNKDNLAISTWYGGIFIAKEQYVELFSVLLENCAEDYVLTEICKTSRSELMQHMLHHNEYDFIMKVIKWCQRKRDMRPAFFSCVLNDHFKVDIKREITKKEFFRGWCESFIFRNCSELFDYVVNLCFLSAEESTEFKLSFTQSCNFIPHCKALVVERDTRELANLLNVVFAKTDPDSVQVVRKFLTKHLGILDELFLTYYSNGNLKAVTDLLDPLASSYPEIITAYKSKLLKSRAGFKACVKHFVSTNDVLVEIIADAFPANQAIEFKSRIIFSCEGIDKVQNMIIDGHSRNNAEKWARLFLESEADRKVLRTMLIKRLNEGNHHIPTKTRRKFFEFLL